MGDVRMIATSARAQEISVQPTLAINDAPWRRSRAGKRRAATIRTSAGVIIVETSKTVLTTTKGVSTTIKIKGASIVLSAGKPTAANQAAKLFTNTEASRNETNVSCALCQNKYASKLAAPIAKSKGKKDSKITLGCRQYKTARQKDDSSKPIDASLVSRIVNPMR